MALIYINLLPESCNWILSPPIHQIDVVITNNPNIFSIDQKKNLENICFIYHRHCFVIRIIKLKFDIVWYLLL